MPRLIASRHRDQVLMSYVRGASGLKHRDLASLEQCCCVVCSLAHRGRHRGGLRAQCRTQSFWRSERRCGIQAVCSIANSGQRPAPMEPQTRIGRAHRCCCLAYRNNACRHDPSDGRGGLPLKVTNDHQKAPLHRYGRLCGSNTISPRIDKCAAATLRAHVASRDVTASRAMRV